MGNITEGKGWDFFEGGGKSSAGLFLGGGGGNILLPQSECLEKFKQLFFNFHTVVLFSVIITLGGKLTKYKTHPIVIALNGAALLFGFYF